MLQTGVNTGMLTSSSLPKHSSIVQAMLPVRAPKGQLHYWEAFWQLAYAAFLPHPPPLAPAPQLIPTPSL